MAGKMLSGMPIGEMREWAREELLDAVDNWIKDNAELHDATDTMILMEQRNRIAKLFKKAEVLSL